MAMIHLEPQTAQMFSRALGALKPPPNLTLSQWADSYRRLSAEASAAQGRWNTDNAPFQREIMDAIGDVHIRKVVAMMCAQSGKTDGLILNTIGYYMSYYPAPIMIVQPTVNLGESFSKDRLATMIRDTIWVLGGRYAVSAVHDVQAKLPRADSDLQLTEQYDPQPNTFPPKYRYRESFSFPAAALAVAMETASDTSCGISFLFSSKWSISSCSNRFFPISSSAI